MLQLLQAWKKRTKKDIQKLEEEQNKLYQVSKLLNNSMEKSMKQKNLKNVSKKQIKIKFLELSRQEQESE